jgi:hypothetical protein
MLERRRLGALGEPSGFSTVGPDARTTAGKTRHGMTRRELKAFPPDGLQYSLVNAENLPGRHPAPPQDGILGGFSAFG